MDIGPAATAENRWPRHETALRGVQLTTALQYSVRNGRKSLAQRQ
jgi:hypothetical protein